VRKEVCRERDMGGQLREKVDRLREAEEGEG